MGGGDDLANVTKNNSYSGFIIDEIRAGGLINSPAYVKFRNGEILYEGHKANDYKAIFDLQLYYLIQEHLEKKDKLVKKGIKCLSLIFIDKVGNYINDNGVVKVLFEKNYRKVYQQKYGHKPSEDQVLGCQGSYFAKTQKGDYTDDKKSMAGNKDLYNLILKDKEKLLSLDNSVEFIFSHSALGVGWDNPNIFNIATLNQSHSEISKRQRLGRGLRICVNQKGERVYDTDETPQDKLVNELTVVPNESYEKFASGYQAEIDDDDILIREKPKGKNKFLIIKRNDRLYNQPLFNDFWHKISQKTDYITDFNEGKIVKRAIQDLNRKIYINQPSIEITKINLDFTPALLEDKNLISTRFRSSDAYVYQPHFAPLDIIDEISQQTSLTRRLVIEILIHFRNKSEILKNPPIFVQQTVEVLKNIIATEASKGDSLKYEAINEYYDKSKFRRGIKTICLEEKLKSTQEKGIYDFVVCDSDIEGKFVQQAVVDSEVELFFKFPAFYKIKTPVGNYNPDFGIALYKSGIYDNNLFFVIETKGTNNIDDMQALSSSEKYKMLYARKHFEALKFKVRYIAPISNYAKFKSEVANVRSE